MGNCLIDMQPKSCNWSVVKYREQEFVIKTDDRKIIQFAFLLLLKRIKPGQDYYYIDQDEYDNIK